MKKKLLKNGFFTVCGYGLLIVALTTGCGSSGGNGGGEDLREQPETENPGDEPDPGTTPPPPEDREGSTT